MGVVVGPGTIPGGRTPICNCCGSALCWDICEQDYREAKAFWDEWICESCNGGVPMSLKRWKATQANRFPHSRRIPQNGSSKTKPILNRSA